MSKENIALDLEVNGVEKSIGSIKELKQAIKAAKDEQLKAAETFGIGSKEYAKASQSVSHLKDKVDDLSDATKSLKGSGIERASSGFSQLGEGLKNLDFDKVKTGLTAMKSAIAAVGIGLIVQLVAYLIENFDSLSQGTGVLAKALRFVGSIVSTVVDALYSLGDALGITNRQLDKQGDAIKANADKAKEAIASQTAEYDRQIAIAKASGKSAIDLEIAKQQAIIETNKALVEQTIAYVRNGGVLTEEQGKVLSSQLDAIKNASNQTKVIEITAEKEKSDRALKSQEEKKAIDAENLKILETESDAFFAKELEIEAADKATNDALKKEHDDLIAYNKAADLANQAQDNTDALTSAQLKVAQQGNDTQDLINLLQVERDIKVQNALLTSDQIKLIDQDLANKKQKLYDDDAKKAKAIEQQKVNATLQLASQSVSSLQSLSDVYFSFKKKNLQKGSAEELKAAKDQFNINKGLSIATATISGIQGVIAAYSSGSAIPVIGAVAGPAFAILAGIAAAANIAKIASSSFDAGGGGGGASVSGGGGAPSAPSIPIPSPPSISTAQNNTSTNFDSNGNNTSNNQTPTINVVATVGVDEISSKTNRVNVLENQAKF